jgi:hypothetical protein
MPDIVAAADEVAASTLLHDAETTLGTLVSGPSSASFGPITGSAGATAFVAGGAVSLIPPGTIRIVDCELHYTLSVSLSLDISDIIPDFCLPQVCIPNPFGDDICTPTICIDWPTVSIPVSHSGVVEFTGDFGLDVHLTGGQWFVDVVIQDVPDLEIDAEAALIVVAITSAAALALAGIPFIGPVLAIVVEAIGVTVGIAGVTGLLGPLLTPFVSGLTFNVYKQPQAFEALPAAGPSDPAVMVRLDAVGAVVDGSGGENELVISVDISP